MATADLFGIRRTLNVPIDERVCDISPCRRLGALLRNAWLVRFADGWRARHHAARPIDADGRASESRTSHHRHRLRAIGVNDSSTRCRRTTTKGRAQPRWDGRSHGPLAIVEPRGASRAPPMRRRESAQSSATGRSRGSCKMERAQMRSLQTGVWDPIIRRIPTRPRAGTRSRQGSASFTHGAS